MVQDTFVGRSHEAWHPDTELSVVVVRERVTMDTDGSTRQACVPARGTCLADVGPPLGLAPERDRSVLV